MCPNRQEIADLVNLLKKSLIENLIFVQWYETWIIRKRIIANVPIKTHSKAQHVLGIIINVGANSVKFSQYANRSILDVLQGSECASKYYQDIFHKFYMGAILVFIFIVILNSCVICICLIFAWGHLSDFKKSNTLINLI